MLELTGSLVVDQIEYFYELELIVMCLHLNIHA